MSNNRCFSLGCTLLVLVSFASLAQTPQTKASGGVNPGASAQHAMDLAKAGRCGEAVPLLKKAIPQSSDKDFRRSAGLAGVRCAMVKNQFDAADDFLRMLNREFPNDPEVLYASIHTYSDLATHASQQLATRAPNSAQAHELNAEALEVQGKWEQASKEYQKVLQQNPQLPGIHFRVGRLLLSEPNPPADAAEQAKKEFQRELEIDPSNAGAEYVLGELAREAQQWDEAVKHFTRAAKLDSSFGDAYLGLGVALVSTKKFSEAVPPLEIAVKLEPENPAAHYNLAIAYTRTGRKQEGDREFAIHREMVQKTPPAQGEAQPQGQPATTPQ
ncbi:MAG: repeat protein [Acidobacteriaceae bacterium]|nr:repeat protein [Acidobacteriaceae bacterium]